MRLPASFSVIRHGIFLLAVLAAAGFFLSIDWQKRFATDVSELLPVSESKEIEFQLLAQLREQEERLLLGFLQFPENSAPHLREKATQRFHEQLRASDAFERIALGRGPTESRAVFETLYRHRFDLLLPLWAKNSGIQIDEADPNIWAKTIVSSLDDFLSRSEATAVADLIPEDPFPLIGYLIDSAPAAFSGNEDPAVQLFWAVQKHSPFFPEGQGPVFEALDAAADAAAELLPGINLRTTSVAKFAAESEKRIRSEITRINLLSFLLVGAVAGLALRQRAALLHMVVIVTCALAGGVAGVLLLFPTVHVLALVVGGLLAGVAVDYGIHTLLHRSPEDHDFPMVLREVRKPLLASGLSTAAGFAALIFADLPLLRQIGAFVAFGLISALATSWLYLPLWKRRPISVKPIFSNRFSFSFSQTAIAIATVCFLIPIAGWLQLSWHDDLRELQPAMPELLENDNRVRAAFTQNMEWVSWICYGETLAEARETVAEFENAWEAEGGSRSTLASLAAWIAGPAESEIIRKTFQTMDGFEAALIHELEANDFEAEAFEPFFEVLHDWTSAGSSRYPEKLNAVASTLDGPVSLLMRENRPNSFFLIHAPAEQIPAGWNPPPNVIPAKQLETLNSLFSRYRESAWQLSVFSLLAISVGVFSAFRRSTPLILAIPVLAGAWGIGLLGFLFSPLSLFHLLGAFLGFCIALDYGIFFEFARRSAVSVPPSIRVSAATTLAAFGVLSLAKIPALAALGSTVFLVVLAALILIELSALWNQKRLALSK